MYEHEEASVRGVEESTEVAVELIELNSRKIRPAGTYSVSCDKSFVITNDTFGPSRQCVCSLSPLLVFGTSPHWSAVLSDIAGLDCSLMNDFSTKPVCSLIPASRREDLFTITNK